MHRIFKLAPPAYKAGVLVSRFLESLETAPPPRIDVADSGFLLYIIASPLYSLDILEFVLRTQLCPTGCLCITPGLPRSRIILALFAHLNPRKGIQQALSGLKVLLQYGIICDTDLNFNNDYLLIWATNSEFEPLVAFLLEHGVSPWSRDCFAFMVAITKGNLELVRMLIALDRSTVSTLPRHHDGVLLRLSDRIEAVTMQQLLVVAINVGSPSLVEFLVKSGASPLYGDGTVIKYAILQKNLDLVRLLIESTDLEIRADGVAAKELSGRLLLFAVMQVGARDIAEYLINERGTVPNRATLLVLRSRRYWAPVVFFSSMLFAAPWLSDVRSGVSGVSKALIFAAFSVQIWSIHYNS